MELDKIVHQQHQLIHLRQEVLRIIDEYVQVLTQWESIETQIKTRWQSNFEQAFKVLFESKGFTILETKESDRYEVQASLGCCVFNITFDQYDSKRVIFSVSNPESDLPLTADQKVDDIRYKLLLEGPINKCKDIVLRGQMYQLMTIKDMEFLRGQMEEKIVTLKEMQELRKCLMHNKVAEEHFIINQNKIKLITTSTQYGVFHTLEELIERM